MTRTLHAPEPLHVSHATACAPAALAAKLIPLAWPLTADSERADGWDPKSAARIWEW